MDQIDDSKFFTDWATSTKQATLNTCSVTFSQSGIPSGITRGVTVDGTRYTSSSSSQTVSGLSGSVNYSYDSSVAGSGRSYACTSGCSGSVSGAAMVTATYTFQPPPYSAEFVSDDIPAGMVADQQYTVHVTVRNTGSNTWTRADGYKLGSPDDSDPFVASARVLLASSASVGTVLLVVQAVLPRASLGHGLSPGPRSA